MSYATGDQFVKAFGDREAIELTNLDDAESDGITETVLERALADASAEMDSYLWRYSLPFASIPQPLIGCCLDIARHRLDRIREREDVRKRYEDWKKWLEQVAKGLVKLGVDESGVTVEQGEDLGEVWSDPGQRLYTNETLAGFY
jgi:phage gp36-like protein